MPKAAVLLFEAQAVLARALTEPLNTLREVRRFTALTEAERQDMQNLPGQERGTPWVRRRIHDLRRTANGPASPTAIAHDVLALLTDGPRPLAGRRAWALMFALPAGDGMCALARCPVTDTLCFGSAIIRLLRDEGLFSAATTLSVAGNRGVALLEFSDGREATFRIGLPAGPAFEPAHAVARWRALEVQRLRPLFDLLTKAKARQQR